MHGEITFLLWFFGIDTIVVVLVIYGTVAKNRWGINLDPIRACPTCGTKQPTVRKPTSLRQALWGGSTCNACGTEWDKWGTLLVKPQI
jgi:hypothetical protein